jgi:dTDP-4-dehydrorhamnose 3,5-epimerase
VIFEPLPLAGAFVIRLERQTDERGSFARSFCTAEFAAHGLETAVAQCNLSSNRHAHTLRGLHYQRPPHGEAKLVRCLRGRAFDVLVDLRRDSPSYARWHGLELSAGDDCMVYIPPGCAHGFQTLADDTELFYQMSQPYVAAAQAGVRWDDPSLAIVWPDAAARLISARDRALPLLD